MDESFDNELSTRLKQFSEEPEASLWPSITARIEEEYRTVRLQRKIRIGWIFIFVSTIMGGLFYHFNLEPRKESSTAALEKRWPLNKSAPDEIVSTPNANIQLPPNNRLDTRKSREPYLNRNAKNLGSKELLINQINEDVQNAEKAEGKLLLDSANQFELSRETNHLPIYKDDSDSTSIRTLTKILSNKTGDGNQQEDANKDQKQNRLSIYFTIMPTLGYQRIEPNSNDNLIVESIDRISTFSTDRLGVRAELGVEYPIANRVNLFGGLIYFQRQQSIGYVQKMVSETDISQGPNGEIILQPEFAYENKSFKYEVRNLGLQVGLSYHLSDKKFLQTIGTGVEFHLALNKLQETPEFTNNPSAYIFYNLYYRIQYPTETKLRAVVQPTLNYSFYINQNRDAPFYVKPYGLGLNVGFTYNFN